MSFTSSAYNYNGVTADPVCMTSRLSARGRDYEVAASELPVVEEALF
jgi:hypothetical protein